MRPELREKILAYNRARARDQEAAEDFRKLLSALPPGQLKNLLRDEVCGAILRKYGFGEVET